MVVDRDLDPLGDLRRDECLIQYDVPREVLSKQIYLVTIAQSQTKKRQTFWTKSILVVAYCVENIFEPYVYYLVSLKVSDNSPGSRKRFYASAASPNLELA